MDNMWVGGWMDVCMGGWADGWMGRRMDGWTDGWMHGWVDGWIRVGVGQNMDSDSSHAIIFNANWFIEDAIVNDFYCFDSV